MNPSSSSSAPRSARRVSIRHRGADPDTATASAADAAILNFMESRRHRKSGREAGPKRSRPRSVPGAVSAWRAFQWPRVPRPAAAALAGVIGLLLVGTVVARTAGGRSGAVHPLHGRLVFGNTIPAGAQIRLLSKSAALPDGKVPRAMVREDGTFAFGTFAAEDGVPAGDYVAVVRLFREAADGSGGKNVLPAKYASSQTSPLSVTVTDGPNAPVEFVIRR